MKERMKNKTIISSVITSQKLHAGGMDMEEEDEEEYEDDEERGGNTDYDGIFS